MSGNANKLIAFNYFGGKFTWCDEIIRYFPPHRSFVDLFCGSMAVTLNKPVSALETANDINGDVVNFFKVLRNQPDELITLLELTPVSRDEYNSSWEIPESADELERARCFYVRVRQSMYGLGIQQRNKGWHICSHNKETRKSQSVTRWNNALAKLGSIIKRIRNVQIENRHWRQVVDMMDSPTTFFYCDPPYPEESRNHSTITVLNLRTKITGNYLQLFMQSREWR